MVEHFMIGHRNNDREDALVISRQCLSSGGSSMSSQTLYNSEC